MILFQCFLPSIPFHSLFPLLPGMERSNCTVWLQSDFLHLFVSSCLRVFLFDATLHASLLARPPTPQNIIPLPPDPMLAVFLCCWADALSQLKKKEESEDLELLVDEVLEVCIVSIFAHTRTKSWCAER